MTKEDTGVTIVKGQNTFEQSQVELIVKCGQNKRKIDLAYGPTACMVLGHKPSISMCKRKGFHDILQRYSMRL